jgi:uncharacterized SAM-binding protein YcdF (DUF218 family)
MLIIQVLGCQYSTPKGLIQLHERCQTALDLAKPYKAVKFILSGGKRGPNKRSEAEYMADYLVSYGIDRKNIMPECYSVSTVENIILALPIIRDIQEKDSKWIIVTHDYHISRALSIAYNLKGNDDIQPEGYGTQSVLDCSNLWKREQSINLTKVLSWYQQHPLTLESLYQRGMKARHQLGETFTELLLRDYQLYNPQH